MTESGLCQSSAFCSTDHATQTRQAIHLANCSYIRGHLSHELELISGSLCCAANAAERWEAFILPNCGTKAATEQNKASRM